MRVIVGMETSGRTRTAFELLGHDVVSVDLLPADDGAPNHIQADVFDVLSQERFDLGIFHPTCTYLTISAEWCYKDNPGKNMTPGVLFGAERREARERALEDFKRLDRHPNVKRKAIENPVGVVSTRHRRPDQIVQPYQFGDDASKKTCLWLTGLPPLKIDPAQAVAPRWICCGLDLGQRMTSPGCPICGSHYKALPRWANQNDSGQNREAPSADRWKNRSATFPGIAAAFAKNWG